MVELPVLLGLPSWMSWLALAWFVLRFPRYAIREWVRLRVLVRWHTRFNRRTVPDRRTQQLPFAGRERRAGRDRRSIVVAI
jgi:hypothetical protein